MKYSMITGVPSNPRFKRILSVRNYFNRKIFDRAASTLGNFYSNDRFGDTDCISDFINRHPKTICRSIRADNNRSISNLLLNLRVNIKPTIDYIEW